MSSRWLPFVVLRFCFQSIIVFCVMVGGGLCFCSRRFGLEGLSSYEFLKITVVPL
ncbi:hypothetical protein HanXRQr2_Chr17g0786481 [Helianthus annuus]|uniref:Uncharacterized protein n=1 Tax=Helianthus annuus TaxID=4232 RepID=A0A9K3DEH5_HELAN|nr:hypothetical protein HanXRQr2_Chr17g0786481 [Helianthus annuus]KAJ0811789.1 hypothetical protein HanPSC8_Chr17g0754681 [Helianthus annuus]